MNNSLGMRNISPLIAALCLSSVALCGCHSNTGTPLSRDNGSVPVSLTVQSASAASVQVKPASLPKEGLDASRYVTQEEASQFLGKPARVLRKSSLGGTTPVGMCLYNAGVGLSLQVQVTQNYSRETFLVAKNKDAEDITGIGNMACWTKPATGGPGGSSFDVLKNNFVLHLYTGRPASAEEMKALALKAVARIP